MRLIVQHVEAASVGPWRSSRLFLCATIAPFTTTRDDWEVHNDDERPSQVAARALQPAELVPPILALTLAERKHRRSIKPLLPCRAANGPRDHPEDEPEARLTSTRSPATHCHRSTGCCCNRAALLTSPRRQKLTGKRGDRHIGARSTSDPNASRTPGANRAFQEASRDMRCMASAS